MIDQKSRPKDDRPLAENIKQETNSLNSSSKPALTMADLMKSVNTSFVTLHKGDILKRQEKPSKYFVYV